MTIPEIKNGARVTQADVKLACDAGALIVRGVVQPEELDVLQNETMDVINYMSREQPQGEGEWFYNSEGIPYRIHWMGEKMKSYVPFLGNPRLLQAIEALCGERFLPVSTHTMVFKLENSGAEVPWHRDWQYIPEGAEGFWDWSNFPIAAMSMALDPYTEETSMYIVPGSHKWEYEEPMVMRKKLQNPFNTEGAVPAILKPGDMLIHNHLVLHGSWKTSGAMRRGLQCSYWSEALIDFAQKCDPDYDLEIDHKKRMLAACVWRRLFCDYARGEVPYLPKGMSLEQHPLSTDERVGSPAWKFKQFSHQEVAAGVS